MNTKRFIITAIVIFVVMQLLSYLIHSIILAPVYKDLSSIWRPDMTSLMWLMLLTGLLYSFLFVYVFIKGYEDRGIGEGIRYGIIITLLIAVPGLFGQYAIYPLPLSLVLKWLAFGTVETIIYGIIAALIYRKE